MDGGQFTVIDGVDLGEVELHEVVDGVHKGHTGVDFAGAVDGAEAVPAGEAMVAEVSLTSDVRKHARTLAAGATFTLVAAESALLRRGNAEGGEETDGVFFETVLDE